MRVQLGEHVTDLATGFAGQVVLRQEMLNGKTLVKVAPLPLVGVALEEPRTINETKLRPSRGRFRGRKPGDGGLTYTHRNQQEIVRALLRFANRVVADRTPGEPCMKLDVGGALVGIHDLGDALEDVLAAIGYQFVDEVG
jgi:hypothetical protein